MKLSNIPANEQVSKGFLRNLLDIIIKEYPELEKYLPSVMNTITQFIPAEIIDNIHDFEGMLNKFMDIYHSDLSNEEKIAQIQGYFEKIMYTLGLDLTDDSLQGTPKRVAKLFVNENQLSRCHRRIHPTFYFRSHDKNS